MKIMERKYICRNGVVERTRYAVGDTAMPRGRKKKKSDFRKQEQNFNSSLRKVARILNCNYSSADGLLITLDYEPEGMEKLLKSMEDADRTVIECLQLERGQIGSWSASSKKTGKKNDAGEMAQEAMLKLWSAADHQLELWLRRVKRKCKCQVKALAVTSDMDHETGAMVRVHHHVVLKAEGISWDLLQQEWKNGCVDIRRLRQQADYTPIALYLMRQVRSLPEKKKYRVSQGMEQPVTEERVVLCGGEIKAPAGAKVLERSEYSEDTVGQYIRYVPKKAMQEAYGRMASKEGGKGEVSKDQQHKP